MTPASMDRASTDGLTVRAMTAADAALAVAWAATEGWNPGHRDADLFRAVDPEGFLVGVVDDTPVACISVVNYDAQTAFLGFYICRPEHRGKGYGWTTWQAGIAHAGDRRIGLDGVVDQQDNYRKSGFRFAHRTIRHSGTVAVPADWQPPEPLVRLGGPGPDAAPLDDSTLAQIASLDSATFPADRSAFLRGWITASGHVALGLVRDGALAGVGVLRPCREGSKIGPLIAPDASAAEALLLGLARSAGTGPVVLDTPEPNAAAVDLARRHGLQPVFETARMWTGPVPPPDLDRLFGVMSFELG